jgi:formylglycine-generating enzyme required for sulfatase activity
MRTNHLLPVLFALFLCTLTASSQTEEEMVLVEGNARISSFYIDKYELTVAQFKKFVEATGYVTVAEKNGGGYQYDFDNLYDIILNEGHFYDYRYYVKNDKRFEKINVANLPANNLCPIDAYAYARWAGKRLLTYEEWLYAAKGGKFSQNFTYSGSSKAKEVAWYDKNSQDRLHEVGQLSPNELGIYDMSGNLREIVEFKQGDSTVFRFMGGDYGSSPEFLQFEMYGTLLKDDIPMYFIGFRFARDVEK